jgi:hypothetical protein
VTRRQAFARPSNRRDAAAEALAFSGRIATIGAENTSVSFMNISSAILYGAAVLALVLLVVLLRVVRRARRRREEAREKARVAEETARRHARKIEESKRVIQTSRNPAAISAGFEIIRDHAEKLSALAEHYDLPDMPSSTPSDLKAFYHEEKVKVLRDRVLEQVETALVKAAEIPKRAGKITYLERALILCLEGKRTTRDEALAGEFEAQAKRIQRMIGDLIAKPQS